MKRLTVQLLFDVTITYVSKMSSAPLQDEQEEEDEDEEDDSEDERVMAAVG